MRILENNALAVLIDIQARLYPHIHEHKELSFHSAKLIEGLQILQIPILITEQYSKGLGATIPELKILLNEHEVIEKYSFSCCDDALFMQKLRETGRKQIILFGIEAHVCVLQTCTDLIAEGFQPYVISNCISSRDPYDKSYAIERMRSEGCFISTVESMLFELLRYSGTDTFKQISKLLK
jgi:nicotinamidase-related amidase